MAVPVVGGAGGGSGAGDVGRVGGAGGDSDVGSPGRASRTVGGPAVTEVRLRWGPGAAGQRYLRAGREIVVGWSRYGDLVISDRSPRPVIEEHAWTTDGRLQLRGRYLGPAAGLGDLVLERDGSGERHRLACERDGERFTALIDVNRMPSFGDELPMRDGRWGILFGPADLRQAD